MPEPSDSSCPYLIPREDRDAISFIFSAGDKQFGPCTANPMAALEPLNRFPFLPPLKTERLGRAADFSLNSYNRAVKEGYIPNMDDDMKFHTVDTARTQRRFDQGVMGSMQNAWYKRKTLKQTTQAYQQKQEQERMLQLGRKKLLEKKKQQIAIQARFGKLNIRSRLGADWSIEPQTSWIAIDEISLVSLAKQEIMLKQMQVEDLAWKGKVYRYLKESDKISPKAGKPYRIFPTERIPVTTGDDTVIQSFMCPGEGADEKAQQLANEIQVAATDQILAAIMSAPTSRLSWHIWVHKIEGKLIFDKSDGSNLDLPISNETAQEAVKAENAPGKSKTLHQFGHEALKISNSFRKHLVADHEAPVEEFDALTPEFVERDEKIPVAYRYRVYTLPPRKDSTDKSNVPIKLITRTELHASLDKKYVSLCVLPETEAKGQHSWKHALESQKGAVLVNELRNNATKIQRFVASGLMAGAEETRLAFVTAKSTMDPDSYLLICVQTHNIADLARQIGFFEQNAWGSVRFIYDFFSQQPDGRYALVKDPQKANLRVYKIGDVAEDQEDNEDDAARHIGLD